MAKHIPTYDERLANILTLDDLDEQLDQAQECKRDAKFEAIGVSDPIERFKLELRADEAASVVRKLYENEFAIEASLITA